MLAEQQRSEHAYMDIGISQATGVVLNLGDEQMTIEITEDEIRGAIVVDQTNSYRANDYIKKQVKAQWFAAVDALMLETLRDEPTQLTMAMKEMDARVSVG